MSKTKYVFGLDVVFLVNNFLSLLFALSTGSKFLTSFCYHTLAPLLIL